MTIILISYLVYIFGVLVFKKKVQVLKLKKNDSCHWRATLWFSFLSAHPGSQKAHYSVVGSQSLTWKHHLLPSTRLAGFVCSFKSNAKKTSETAHPKRVKIIIEIRLATCFGSKFQCLTSEFWGKKGLLFTHSSYRRENFYSQIKLWLRGQGRLFLLRFMKMMSQFMSSMD